VFVSVGITHVPSPLKKCKFCVINAEGTYPTTPAETPETAPTYVGGVTQLPVPCKNCNSFAINGAGTAPFNPLAALVAPCKLFIDNSGTAGSAGAAATTKGNVAKTPVNVPAPAGVAHVPSPFKNLL